METVLFTEEVCTGGRIIKLPDSEWSLRDMLYIPGRDARLNAQALGLFGDFSKLSKKYDYGSGIFNLRDITEDILSTKGRCFYNLPNLDKGRQPRKWSELYGRIWETFDTGRPLPEYGALMCHCGANDGLIFEFVDSSAQDWLVGFETMLKVEQTATSSSDPERELYTKLTSDILFGRGRDRDPENFADEEFRFEVRRLTSEIEDRVRKLRAYGLEETIIQSLFLQEPELSRLVVTEDFRILLPDYNGIEIKMEPLPKAVYLLFLRHPEGLMFKQLPGCRAEFESIYMSVTNRDDISSIRQSIDRVLDPTDNSINEKCARIRAAFISRFDDRLAEKYYITGGARFPKKIELDRRLVRMECDIPDYRLPL